MATLSAPGGIVIYGGVGAFTARSADGSIYVVYCGERPGHKFGTHIYRILTNGQMQWVEYTPFTEARVETTIEPDGMYISFGVDRERRPERVKVPGFVTPAFPGGTQSFPPGPVVVAVEDSTARNLANTARNEASAAIAKLKSDLEKRLKALEGKPAAQAGVSEQSARDIAWTLAADRFYAELNNPNSPVANLLREYAKGLR